MSAATRQTHNAGLVYMGLDHGMMVLSTQGLLTIRQAPTLNRGLPDEGVLALNDGAVRTWAIFAQVDWRRNKS